MELQQAINVLIKSCGGIASYDTLSLLLKEEYDVVTIPTTTELERMGFGISFSSFGAQYLVSPNYSLKSEG